MCGIVGLFLKDKSLEINLGRMLSEMLVTMTDRGPDSAGIAVYNANQTGKAKITVQVDNPQTDFHGLEKKLSKAICASIKMDIRDTHAVLTMPQTSLDAAMEELRHLEPVIRIMGRGESIEIYKEIGLPEIFVSRFDIAKMSGTHGIGHTRMATESAVTTMGAHPFNTGSDQCLVHNGSLSNHNSMRRKLRRKNIRIETENDSEVAAAYLTWKIHNGFSLDEALESSLSDLDGFFTFVVATKDGFGVVRDAIACKPAVMAETSSYVAFGSEYRALVNLPNIEKARVWEPEPATVYFWNH